MALTPAEEKAQKRAAQCNARIQSSQTPREQLGHAYDFLRATLDGADPHTIADVSGQLVEIAKRYNGLFERKRRPSPRS